eukprot:5593712-Pyramimonas_sp.AAC.1
MGVGLKLLEQDGESIMQTIINELVQSMGGMVAEFDQFEKEVKFILQQASRKILPIIDKSRTRHAQVSIADDCIAVAVTAPICLIELICDVCAIPADSPPA